MSARLVAVVVEEPGWQDALPDIAEIAETAGRAALDAASLAPEDYTIALLACDDGRIAELNGRFRDSTQPTNVLSWPSFDLAPPAAGAPPPPPPLGTQGRPLSLGDVALALQTCQHEAQSAGIPLKNHCTHLILHGCLHLLGYDHQTLADAGIMEGIERDRLAALGIPDPYA